MYWSTLILYSFSKASLNEPVQKTLMNVKKTLSPPENKKHQTNERKDVQAEWFTSPEELKVRHLTVNRHLTVK